MTAVTEQENKPQQTLMELPVEKIQFISLNPNSMDQEAFQTLKLDMQKNGRGGISPIVVAGLEDIPGYVCVDGNHRLKAAKELGWETIPCIFDEAIKDETSILLTNYKKNVERGQTDPMMEAKLFQLLKDTHGLTDEQIGEQVNMERSQVTKRRGLMKVDNEALEKLTKFTQNVNPSIMEILSTKEPEIQKEVVKRAIDQNRFEGKFEDRAAKMTVSYVGDLTKRVVNELKEEKELLEALKSPDCIKPLCPTCDQGAEEIAHDGLPWVQCKRYHRWNIKTGKREEDLYKEQQQKAAGERLQKAREEPDFIRVENDIHDFIQVGLFLAQDAIREADYLSEIKLYGKAKDGGKFDVTISEAEQSALIDVDVGKKKEFSLSLERKHYAKTSDLAKFKTVVRSGKKTLRTDKDREDFSKEIEQLFKKFDRISQESDNEVLTSDEKQALVKLKKRLKDGGNQTQLQALLKLEVLAGA